MSLSFLYQCRHLTIATRSSCPANRRTWSAVSILAFTITLLLLHAVLDVSKSILTRGCWDIYYGISQPPFPDSEQRPKPWQSWSWRWVCPAHSRIPFHIKLPSKWRMRWLSPQRNGVLLYGPAHRVVYTALGRSCKMHRVRTYIDCSSIPYTYIW